MKKFLSLLLAAMMLLSCTTAFAASDTIINDDLTADASVTKVWDDDGTVDGVDIDVYDIVNYGDDEGFDISGEMATELWLQVDATGQIDATVPLVVVFQTNIDGGHATSPSQYQIVNNSSADLVVTKIETDEVAFNATKQPMDLIEYDEDADLADDDYEDKYMVRLNVDGTDVNLGKSETGVYDLFTASHENDKIQGGLFELEKATSAGVGVVTPIQLEMQTGRLSFVTSRKVTGTGDDAKDAGMEDKDMGIQLLTITYTVAIDTSDAIGEEILGANGKSVTAATGSVLEADYQAVDGNGSDTVGTGADMSITPKASSDADKQAND